MTGENKAVEARFMEEVLNEKNLAAADGLVAEGYKEKKGLLIRCLTEGVGMVRRFG